MNFDLDVAARAIGATREGLAAAGYTIDVSARSGRLVFTVRADEGACEECLVPRPIFTDILGRELAEAGVKVDSFDLLYPLDDDSQLR
ncbi:MAG: hypothetical protein F9K36_07645 [Burkholderiaceae bacterium]|nr:MAG: hypothetical protein F9K36_07645 [Burkholderiaceae bacterium]